MRNDPIETEIFKNVFHSTAEEMGATLRRTAFSPNIKERRDYSCAIFNSSGEAIAMGDHMPVHLGSMPMSVRAVLARMQLGPGDMAMLNDPFCGGTHLPDITLVAPFFSRENFPPPKSSPRSQPARLRNLANSQPFFFVASRAHHADIGGAYAGSMGLCREIYQEGLRIPPVKLMRSGKIDADVLALLLNNVRTPTEREGDLGAQIAACNKGLTRLEEIRSRYGLRKMLRASTDLLDYSERMMWAFLAQVPPGKFSAEDYLDDDGVSEKPVRIAATITFRRTKNGSRGGSPSKAVTIDFTGCDPQVQGSINAVEAITYSACFYVFRCLLAEDVPATTGLMRPIEVVAPSGTIVNARPPAAVAGGNVETSQRIVDVLLRALAQALPDRIPAASSGTMNNLTIGGIDPRGNEPFAYYETIAGGMGARPTKPGVSGVHTHMTNSLNTPAEALEYAYPLRVSRYSLRNRSDSSLSRATQTAGSRNRDKLASGGQGKYRGGEGIVREIEALTDAEVTLLSDRRRFGPYGLQGGKAGAPGRAEVVRRYGQREILPGKSSVHLGPGDCIRIESPSGGGWGRPRNSALLKSRAKVKLKKFDPIRRLRSNFQAIF